MSRVLVTGGSGFIGTNIVEHYVKQGNDVVSLDIEAPRCAEHAKIWRSVDILDEPALRKAINDVRPEIVFHMAARTDLFGRALADYGANTAGVQNVVNSLLDAKDVKLAVFASSMLVCRVGYDPRDENDYCPSTPYGESKVFGERVVRATPLAELPWVVVRPTSIWGPWFRSPYREFFDTVRRGLYFHPGTSRVRRSYGYVGNTVRQLARLAVVGGGPLLGKTVYLADFEPTDLKSWADLIAEEFGVRPVRALPMTVFRMAARAGDFLSVLGIRAPMTTFRLNNMLTEMVCDLSPLRDLYPRLDYTVDEGVRMTCDWMRRFD